MPFADQLIDSRTADDLAAAIALVHTSTAELDAAGARLAGLALRERADLLRDALLADVPGSYAELARVVRAARSATFRGWLIWPVTAAVATRAVEDPDDTAFDDALALLAELTGLLTSEFAIRILLRHDLDRALATIATWTASGDEHVRRLASEGTRPYLPWSVRVPALTGRPGATVPILDGLYRDESEYVRRSVANHLNDLSRDAPALVTETAARWLADPDENTARLVRHALRTLVKRGDPAALALLGFPSAADSLEIDGPHLDRAVVAMGGAVEFRASIRNIGSEALRLAVDYVVHHRKSNGGQTSKTFKLTTATVRPGDVLEVRRAHSFRAITTRRYYAGPHAIALQINGVETERAVFDLVAE
ncbi:DNA alkylation repair protein [Rathayibacter sp. VKM Ac-2759]|uniref:DNA alkylation repair protein n=1 Tax=Rathayibacter sp. VKM Ac-2759 TaxID=2609252 RepID=UPI001318CEE3|nr:DNA alkylation repair protein [Rathayibacter sp. VKM Ac-2759]QHC67932.1 DNA alkylation repair protein [Rathayibacter sp. VKM Ac-2759]